MPALDLRVTGLRAACRSRRDRRTEVSRAACLSRRSRRRRCSPPPPHTPAWCTAGSVGPCAATPRWTCRAGLEGPLLAALARRCTWSSVSRETCRQRLATNIIHLLAQLQRTVKTGAQVSGSLFVWEG